MINSRLMFVSLLAVQGVAYAADNEFNNGTDPTKLSASASVSFEHLDLTGSSGILSVKPSVFGGSERPGDWGVEATFKVIGF